MINNDEHGFNDHNEAPVSSYIVLPKPQQPQPKNRKQVWLKSISSLFLYIAIGYIFFNQNFYLILILTGVVIFHEMGHFIAMKAYSYKELGIFFIPLLGAYVSGNKNEVSQKQSAVILLAGPVPGIILGVIFFLLSGYYDNYLFERIAWILIYLNVLNLLPVYPLDGGQLLNRLFLDSYHVLGKIFVVLSAAAMTWFTIAISFYPLLIFPVMLLMRLFTDLQYDKLTSRLEHEGIDLDKDYEEITDEQYWQIRNALIKHSSDYKEFESSPPYAYADNEEKIVTGIKSVLQRSLYQDLPLAGKFLVIAIWLGSFLVPFLLPLPLRFF